MKVKMRMIRGEAAPGPTINVILHLFEVLAHIEREGKAFAGCIQGFEGAVEAVGESEEEIIQELFNGLSMMIDYHIGKKTLEQFMTDHNIEFRPIDTVVESVPTEGVDKEVTYMPPILHVSGGVMACAV